MVGGVLNNQLIDIKMKKILLLSMMLLSPSLSAQNVELTLLQNSLRMEGDSLYFSYKIQNKSDTAFVFYNIRTIEVLLDLEDDADYINGKTHLYALIYDNKDNLPSDMIMTTAHDTYERLMSSKYYGKYIVLEPGKSVKYDTRISIWNLTKARFMALYGDEWSCLEEAEKKGLENGIYKFQLVYFSWSDNYKRRYVKEKKNNARLKDTHLFEGEIKSNVCIFELQDKRQ